MPLSSFHPLVARWFQHRFGEPTSPQRQGWDAIRAGHHTLISAPTGSGKTLAAFLHSLDQLFREGLERDLPDETRVVYVSPLKALSADIHLNLAEPRREIRRIAGEMLRTVRTVIVDEIHAVVESRRGAHLALTLERLSHVAAQPVQRIGLSATVKPIEEVGEWLVGTREQLPVNSEQ